MGTEEQVEKLWYEDLNFCGCGMPEDTRDWLSDVLEAIQNKQNDAHGEDNVGKAILRKPDELKHFVYYVLDAIGLTEHGGSVGGCWLSEKGKEALNTLKSVYGEQAQ